MNKKDWVLLIILIIFTFSIFLTKNNPECNEKIVTFKVEGMQSKELASLVEESINRIRGVREVIILPETEICMIRFDTRNTNIQYLTQIFEKLNIKIRIATLPDYYINLKHSNRPLFSIKVAPASRN